MFKIIYKVYIVHEIINNSLQKVALHTYNDKWRHSGGKAGLTAAAHDAMISFHN